MPKLERIKQEIFANNAGSREVTAFGTAKAETPTYSKDAAVIQNNNFLQGWSSAILADKAPYMEDSNALYYAVTRQLAYILQAGIPEWNAETTYYQNDFARLANSSNEVTVYKSLTDDNIGNNPETTLNVHWKIYSSEHTDEVAPSATYEIGLPQPTFSNTLYANEIWLEGQTVNRIKYANLFNIYGTTYGAGNGTTTFKLPDCRNRVLWGSTSFGYIAAGLPNITGTFNALVGRDQNYSTGAFTHSLAYPGVDNKEEHETSKITFNASRSSSVYGKSSTVQPPAIKCRVKTRWY